MKSIIVTGASGGIGYLVANHLAEDFRVIGVDKIESTEVTHLVDLSCLESVADFADSVELESGSSFGGIVHCAGVQLKSTVGGLGTDAWLRMLNVNVRSVDVLTHSLLDRFPQCQASVVVLGSVHSRVTSRNALGYSVSKAALSGWVRAAALELAPVGVRVNCVAPGAIETEMLRSGLNRRGAATAESDLMDQIVDRTPLGRLGVPRDLFAVISFLLEPNSSGFITGAELAVDGGVSVCLASEV